VIALWGALKADNLHEAGGRCRAHMPLTPAAIRTERDWTRRTLDFGEREAVKWMSLGFSISKRHFKAMKTMALTFSMGTRSLELLPSMLPPVQCHPLNCCTSRTSPPIFNHWA